MISDDLGKQLHDRATRGKPLTEDEQKLLAEWYRRLDEEEGKMLSRVPASSGVDALREQVNATLAQIVEVAKHIQMLNRENDVLRNEIALLEQHLIQKTS